MCALSAISSGADVGDTPNGNLPCENNTSMICPNEARTLVFVLFTNTLDFSFSLNAVSGPYNPL